MLCSICKVCTSGGLLNLLWGSYHVSVDFSCGNWQFLIEKASGESVKWGWSGAVIELTFCKVRSTIMEEQFKQIPFDNSPVTVQPVTLLENLYFPNHLLYFNIIMCNYLVGSALRDLNPFVYHGLRKKSSSNLFYWCTSFEIKLCNREV